jgi:hypothetical protein
MIVPFVYDYFTAIDSVTLEPLWTDDAMPTSPWDLYNPPNGAND